MTILFFFFFATFTLWGNKKIKEIYWETHQVSFCGFFGWGQKPLHRNSMGSTERTSLKDTQCQCFSHLAIFLRTKYHRWYLPTQDDQNLECTLLLVTEEILFSLNSLWGARRDGNLSLTFPNHGMITTVIPTQKPPIISQITRLSWHVNDSFMSIYD